MKNRNKTAIRRVVCKRPSWIHLNSWWTSFIKSSGGKQTHIAEPRSTKGKVRGRSFQCWSDEFNGFPLDSFELLFRQLLTCCLSTVRLLECFSWSSTIRTPGFKTGGIRWDTVDIRWVGYGGWRMPTKTTGPVGNNLLPRLSLSFPSDCMIYLSLFALFSIPFLCRKSLVACVTLSSFRFDQSRVTTQYKTCV